MFSFVPSAIPQPFLSYRLQILQRSLFELPEQNWELLRKASLLGLKVKPFEKASLLGLKVKPFLKGLTFVQRTSFFNNSQSNLVWLRLFKHVWKLIVVAPRARSHYYYYGTTTTTTTTTNNNNNFNNNNLLFISERMVEDFC